MDKVENSNSEKTVKYPSILSLFHIVIALTLFPIGYWAYGIGVSLFMWDRLIIGVVLISLLPVVLIVGISFFISWFGPSFGYCFPRVAKYVYWFYIPATLAFLGYVIVVMISRVSA